MLSFQDFFVNEDSDAGEDMARYPPKFMKNRHRVYIAQILSALKSVMAQQELAAV